MPEINLLQKEAQGIGRFHIRQPSKFSFYLVAALLVFELFFYGFLKLSERGVHKELLAAEQRSVAIDLEVSKNESNRQKAISAQTRLKNLGALLSAHIFWSQAFSEFENKTYKPIQLESLQVDNANHKFVITGLAASQTDLAKFMLGLKTSPYFLEVTLRSSAAQQTEVSGYLFNLELTFDPKLLRK